jgi:hydroxymethylbilane synthase
MILILGTRGSALALRQAEYVASLIERHTPDTKVNLVKIRTTGDRILDAPLAKIGTKGLFTKEIEEALLEKKIDLAVHSMKDLPTDLPDGLKVGCVIEREDPRDVFVSGDGRALDELTPGEIVGTSSLRRKAFLLNRFPYLQVKSVRGNVDTRLKKIRTEGMAGIILAAAGMNRMGFHNRITSFLSSDLMIPAIGQGAIAIEIRQDDYNLAQLLYNFNHQETALCVGIERAFLKRLGGGCQVPMAAHCNIEGSSTLVVAAIAHPDGNPIFTARYCGNERIEDVGIRLADSLLEQGASSVLTEVLGNGWMPCS